MGVKEFINIYNANEKKNDPNKHKTLVCMHWKQGQCKNGDNCNFLHEDIKERLPLCKYFKEQGLCNKGDQCLYKHEYSNLE